MKRVLCYGDSNTWGYQPGQGNRFPADVRWTGVVSQILKDKCIILEDGLNGRTTVFDDYYTECRNGKTGLGYSLCAQAPIDLLVIGLGTNDLKYTGAVGSYKGLDELLRMVNLNQACFDAAGVPIFTGAPKVLVISPIQLHPDIAQLRPESSLAAKYEESVKFPGYYRIIAEKRNAWFLDASAYGHASEADCVHMNAQSHCALGVAVAEKIKEILELN